MDISDYRTKSLFVFNPLPINTGSALSESTTFADDEIQ